LVSCLRYHRHAGQGSLASVAPRAGVPSRAVRAGGWRTRLAQARCVSAVSTRCSWVRDRMPSLAKILRRWYSTVRGLRNSRAPISGLEPTSSSPLPPQDGRHRSAHSSKRSTRWCPGNRRPCGYRVSNRYAVPSQIIVPTTGSRKWVPIKTGIGKLVQNLSPVSVITVVPLVRPSLRPEEPAIRRYRSVRGSLPERWGCLWRGTTVSCASVRRGRVPRGRRICDGLDVSGVVSTAPRQRC
jgi:hypothetical protein